MEDDRKVPNGGDRQPPLRNEVEMPEYDWEGIDWLEEPVSDPVRPQTYRQPDSAPRQGTQPLAQQPRSRQDQEYRQQPRSRQDQEYRQQPRPRQDQEYRQQSRSRQDQEYRQQPRSRQSYQQQPPRPRQEYRQPQAEPWRDGRAVAVEPDDYRPRRRSGRKQSIPLIILVVILAGGVLFAGGKLGSILLNYHRDRSAYNDLAEAALAGLAEPNTTSEPGATPEPEEEQAQSEVPIAVDWDLLRNINTDIVGWLYCPNTPINYPVMQTTDNDYYLHRSYDRQPNTAGALFADYNSAIGITYSNYIIYGHNMKDGSMFATVYDYVDQEFYNQHPVMYLLTPTQNYRVDLIAAHIVESTLDNYPGYFQGNGDQQNYLNQITSSSFFRTNANVSTDYQIITMSTCDYSSNYRDPRFLLHGLLVPEQ